MSAFKKWLERRETLQESGIHGRRNKSGMRFSIDTPGWIATDVAEENGWQKADFTSYMALLKQRVDALEERLLGINRSAWASEEGPSLSQVRGSIEYVRSSLTRTVSAISRHKNFKGALGAFADSLGGGLRNTLAWHTREDREQGDPRVMEFIDKDMIPTIRQLIEDFQTFCSRFATS